PKFNEINWHRTILANLKHYQPEYNSIIPERLIGYGRMRESLREVVLCIDRSGSMAQSVVYASIFGAVMASLPALKTQMVLFSTQVVDITDKLSDPVDALFGVQLRGGTNIAKALAYCEQLITTPAQTLLVLITDLFEGNKDKGELVERIARFSAEGTHVITLLALNDQGTPKFNRAIAAELVDIGIPAFACTPALFPDLMGAALAKRDIGEWAAANGIVTAPFN
ncbi:MAG TPA: VWA domain-containing protein, partial [Anaerolineae bacterium]|nr:VWA domain-containing protein [Anaerolineae bacterium]